MYRRGAVSSLAEQTKNMEDNEAKELVQDLLVDIRKANDSNRKRIEKMQGE